MKRLVIVSHTPHYRQGDTVCGWGATVREISYLAGMFESVCHVAPLHEGPAPGNCMQYEARNVVLKPVLPAGGDSLADKLSILRRFPEYARQIAHEMRGADAVHVRCPANIAMLTLPLLRRLPSSTRVWVKYAGSWNGYPGEPLSYRLQRTWLARMPGRAIVTVNGAWPGQPGHVRSFYNPCLTGGEIAAADEVEKSDLRQASLLFVGRLDSDKGFPVFLKTIRLLRERGLQVDADVVGDGPDRARYEEQARLDGTAGRISFCGWRTREQLNGNYRRANFVLLPSRAEGWPKVLSEAMAFGAVPLASRVGSIGQYLAEFGCGRSFETIDPIVYCDAVAQYMANPGQWAEESAKARAAARRFTYDAYLRNVAELFGVESPRGAGYAF